ncbi:MAG: hypothetical protein ACYCWE_09600 [Eubacteriales bacterium]
MYIKHTWLQRLGVKLNRFKDQNNVQYEFTADPESVSQAGTPFSAAWMNEIEDGIYNADRRVLIAKSITTTWTGSAAPYTQNIAVTGLTTADILIIAPALTGVYADDINILLAWAQISRIKIIAGNITVYGNSVTEVAIPIQILIAFGGNSSGVDAFLCNQGNTLKKKLYTKIITADTVWTAPHGLVGNSVNVRLFGGGGGGGGGTVDPICGGGGGGGHMASNVITIYPDDAINIIIGNGGTYNVSADGGTGGITSFGTLLSANGGAGGFLNGVGGNGGTGGGSGANNIGAAGGSGSYGGGGGGGGSGAVSSYGANGGAGGTYGGGGGGHVGGAAGGAGTGAGGARNTNGSVGTNTTATINEFTGTGAGGAKGTSYSGGGGGGIGGVGGSGSTAGGSSTTSVGSGGGGGYGSTGGKGGGSAGQSGGGGGGGGGYGGVGRKGGNSSVDYNGGGGGGGGYGANNYGAGGNGRGGEYSGTPEDAMDGIVILTYYVVEY